MDSFVGEVDGKDRTGFRVTRNSEYLATLLHEEYPDRHVQVSVAGLLVVVEDTDTVVCATEDTPALLPAL